MLVVLHHLHGGHIFGPDTLCGEIVATLQHVEVLNVKTVDGRTLITDRTIVRDRDSRQLAQHVSYGAVVLACIGRHEVVQRVAVPPQLLRLNQDLAQLHVFLFHRNGARL